LTFNKGPRPIAIEKDERHREPRWLLALTLVFVVGTLALLVFYARVPAFLS